MADMRVRFCGMLLRSPIIVSSAGITETVTRMRKCYENGAGAVIMKSYFEEEISRKSPTPRFHMIKHDAGSDKTFSMMSYEQASEWDIDRYSAEVAAAKLALPDLKIFPSINCITDDGWVEAAKKVATAGADGIEMNTSCPHGSITFRGGPVEEAIFHVVRLVRAAVTCPIVAKISPMLTAPGAVARGLEEIGVQGVTIFNRMTGLDLDIESERPVLHGGYAGHGGPWAIQYPLRWISQVRKEIRIDIAGSGGVTSWEDLVKYFLVGANAVQVCTAIYMNGYEVIRDLLEGLDAWMDEKGYASIDDFRGKAAGKIVGTNDVDRRKLYRAEIAGVSKYAPCRATCPASVPAQAYIRLTAERRFSEALDMVRSANPFQSVCGYVCYHPCEDACTRGAMDAPVNIRGIKRFLCSWGRKNRPLIEEASNTSAGKTGKKVAIIGAGPAGLTLAHDLLRKGHKATVFDRMPQPGGMLRYGIPSYRLPREILDEDIEYVRAMGADIRCGVAFGREVTIESLKSEGYDAVAIAVGKWRGAALGIPGEEGPGVVNAIEYLRRANMREAMSASRRIVVIGGGDTALDAARCAVRNGASEVYLLYRRTKDEMPADKGEVVEAEEEGVRILYLVTPVEIMRDGGRLSGIRCTGGYLDAKGEDGRRKPKLLQEATFELPADMIIAAVSQSVEPDTAGKAGVICAGDGSITVDPMTGMTSVRGVFAAGDAAGEQASVISAIGHARRVAAYLDYYLAHGECASAGRLLPEWEEVDKRQVLSRHTDDPLKSREEAARRASDTRRRDFGMIEEDMDEEAAVREAERCLACGCGVGCGLCSRVCIYDAVIREGAEYRIDPEKCDGCGWCCARCRTGAISMVRTS